MRNTVTATELVLGVLLPALGQASCIPVPTTTTSSRPQGHSNLEVTVVADPSEVAEGTPVVLTASASGGRAPYFFRWDVNSGPDGVALVDPQSATTATDPLPSAGRYVFRLVVTDADGFNETAFVDIEVAAGLEVTVALDDGDVFEGMSAGLSAAVTGGTLPYSYTWEQLVGNSNLDLGGETSPSVTVGPFTAAGEHIFVVTVTDANGFEAMDDVAVDVMAAVSTHIPEVMAMGVSAELTVERVTATEGLSYLWEIKEGQATLDDPTSENPKLTSTAEETIGLRLSVTIPGDGGTETTTTRDFEILSIAEVRPRVLVEVSYGEASGTFTIELDLEAAPLHAGRFLAYVLEGFYDGTVFHRNACVDASQPCEPFVLQGGGFERVGGKLVLKEPTRDAVAAETDAALSNGDRFTVSLALTGGDPASGNAQFFVNLKDNPNLDDMGFRAFGTVVDGTDTIDAIVATPRTTNPFIPGEVSLPAEDVIMTRVTRVLP